MLDQFIAQDYMLCGAVATDKPSAISLLVGHAHQKTPFTNASVEAIVRSLLLRETKRTSGYGKEIAIPHVINPAVHTMTVVFATFKTPVPWDSTDGKPVRIAGLILSPARYLREYFPLTLRITKMLTDDNVRKSLLNMTTAAQMITVLNSAKDRYA